MMLDELDALIGRLGRMSQDELTLAIELGQRALAVRRAKIAEEYRRTGATQAIAMKWNLDRTHVRLIAKRAGVPVANPSGRPNVAVQRKHKGAVL